METADEFVDNVLSAACRLAKLRPDQTLDIRDIQTVLERNYNIRIPGYSLDEARVVRRVQPAPGWNQKMSAINAAKVMGGKPDA
jgi:transcription initiation factor TFIID subunit 12